MNCTICGSPIPPGQQFCPNCGCHVSQNEPAGSMNPAGPGAYGSQMNAAGGYSQTGAASQPVYGQSAGYTGAPASNPFAAGRREYKTVFRVFAGILSVISYLSALAVLGSITGGSAALTMIGLGNTVFAMVISFAGGLLMGTGYLLLAIQKGEWKTAVYLLMGALACSLVSSLINISVFAFSGLLISLLLWGVSCIIPGIFWFCLNSGAAFK